MEVGNILFGHSRGRVEVPRGEGFEDALTRLFDVIDQDRDQSWREYGTPYESDVFEVHPYYWGDCTCGYEARWAPKEEAWTHENPHADNCYQAELKARESKYDRESGYAEIDRAAFGREHSLMAGFDVQTDVIAIEGHPIGHAFVMEPRSDAAMKAWRKAYGKRETFMTRLYRDLCKKFGLSAFGCAVHCTCGRDARWHDFAATDDHDARCPIVLPNFWYKPTGYQLRWYKYPLRDSYGSEALSLADFNAMIDACIQSIAPPGPPVEPS